MLVKKITAIGITLITFLTLGTVEPSIADTTTSQSKPYVYPRNANGQTYGSAFWANSPEEEPDLISVVGDNNIEGYALKEDLNGPQPNNPEEALDYMRNLPEVRRINVYAPDGKIILDTFSIKKGRVIYDEQSEEPNDIIQESGNATNLTSDDASAIDEKTWWQVGEPSSLTGEAAFVNSLISNNGLIYVGTNNGVWVFNGKTWSQVGGSQGLVGDAVYTRNLTSYNGFLYAETGAGIWKWDGKVWSQINTSLTEVSLVVHNGKLYLGSDNGIWLEKL